MYLRAARQVIGEGELGGIEAWGLGGVRERLWGSRKSKSRVKARERKTG